jgi:hypothetical protein
MPCGTCVQRCPTVLNYIYVVLKFDQHGEQQSSSTPKVSCTSCCLTGETPTCPSLVCGLCTAALPRTT